MKKIIAPFLLITGSLFGQTHSVHEVFEAERAFARTSREHNTKVAFINFLAKDALVCARGEFFNGLSRWNEIPADTSLLDWWPVYGDVSLDGDLGYSTGPFEFYPGRKKYKPVGLGYYSSIWKKENGAWKVFMDLGISLKDSDQPGKEASPAKLAGKRSDATKALLVVESIESKLTEQLNASGVSFKNEYLAEEFRVHRPSQFPMTSLEALNAFDESARKHSFETVGHGISSSGDLAYSYGNVKIDVNRNNEIMTLAANYMRIWKNIKGDWKLVFDVVSFG